MPAVSARAHTVRTWGYRVGTSPVLWLCAALVLSAAPASAQSLSNNEARALATRVDALRTELAELDAIQNAQSRSIDSLATYREPLYQKWQQGVVDSQEPLRELADLKPVVPVSWALQLALSMASSAENFGYDLFLAGVRANLISGKGSVQDRATVETVEAFGHRYEENLRTKQLEISHMAQTLEACGFVPPPPPPVKRPPPGPLSVDSLLAGRCIATDQTDNSGLVQGVLPSSYHEQPTVSITITGRDANGNVEGRLTYFDKQISTKLAGYKDGDILLLREVRLVSGDNRTLGSVWRLRSASAPHHLKGNIRNGGWEEPGAEDGLPRMEQALPPVYEPSYRGPTQAETTPVELWLKRSVTVNSETCDNAVLDRLARRGSRFTGRAMGLFLDRPLPDITRSDGGAEPVRATFKPGGVLVIECLGDDLLGTRATVNLGGSNGAFQGMIVCSTLRPEHRNNSWLKITCVDGGRQFIGQWWVGGEYPLGPWAFSLTRDD